MVMLHYWLCWTYLLHLLGRPLDASTTTQSIVRYQRHSAGSCLISTAVPSALSLWKVNPCSCVVLWSRKIVHWTDPFSPVHRWSCAASRGSWTVCTLVCWRYTAAAAWAIPLSSKTQCLCVSTKLYCGCDRIDCTLMLASCTHQHVGNIRSVMSQSRCAQTLWHQFGLCEISASMLTATCRCQLTLCVQSPVVSWSCEKSTTSVSQPLLCSLVSLVLTRLDYGMAFGRPSETSAGPDAVSSECCRTSCFLLASTTTWRLSYGSCIGYEPLNILHFGWWSIAVVV